MSREIKFRAFCKDRSGMYINVGFINHKQGFSIIPFDSRGNEMDRMYSHSHSIELMQYTGLKDKNSKEIYEGDIVKWGHISGQGEETWHRVAKVEFSPDLQFKILHYIDSKTLEKKPTDNYIFQFGRFSYQETHRYLEVIGNIYENPELIKDTP